MQGGFTKLADDEGHYWIILPEVSISIPPVRSMKGESHVPSV